MAKGLRHLLKDCRDRPQDEKDSIIKARYEEKGKRRPARSTSTESAEEQKNSGPLTRPVDFTASFSCQITVSDGLASIFASGRCNDESDESIISPDLTRRAVLHGTGRLEKIKPITTQAARSMTQRPKRYKLSGI